MTRNAPLAAMPALKSMTWPAWPLWPLRLVLWLLFLGPPAAALFMASGVPAMADAGHLAREVLARYVCPTPAQSYQVGAHPMAVCARCWGATIGLWVAWLGVRSGWFGAPWRRYAGLAWPLRLLLAGLPFLLWWAEIGGWPAGWPGSTAPLVATLLNGVQAGAGAGLFLCSAWPGLQHATTKVHEERE
jgi:hypothetical protein